jgi:hypothetical protein
MRTLAAAEVEWAGAMDAECGVIGLGSDARCGSSGDTVNADDDDATLSYEIVDVRLKGLNGDSTDTTYTNATPRARADEADDDSVDESCAETVSTSCRGSESAVKDLHSMLQLLCPPCHRCSRKPRHSHQLLALTHAAAMPSAAQ